MKKSLISLIAALIAALSVAAAQAADCPKEPQMSRSVQNAMFEAQKMADAGKAKEAATHLDKFMADNPDSRHYRLSFYRGVLAFQLKDTAKAEKMFLQAIKLYPCSAAAVQNLAVIRFEQGRHIEAAELMLRAYELSEEPRPEMLYSAGVFYMAGDKPEKGLPILEKLAAFKNPEPHWLAALVQCYLSLKRPADAMPTLRRLLAIQPEKAVNWRLLAAIEVELRHYTQAAAALEVAYRLDPPEKAITYRQLADIYRAAGAAGQAAKYYRRAFGPKPDAKDLDTLARVYLEAHDHEQALALAEAAARAKPTAKRWALVGRIMMSRKLYDQAFGAFERAAAIDDKGGQNSLMAGYAAWQMERAKAAEKAFARAAQHAKEGGSTAKEAQRCLQSVRNWLQAQAMERAEDRAVAQAM